MALLGGAAALSLLVGCSSSRSVKKSDLIRWNDEPARQEATNKSLDPGTRETLSRSLARAIVNHEYETASKLILDGADVNFQDERGWTALMNFSPWAFDISAIRFLLAHRADVNIKSNDGVTALMIAAGAGNEDAVKILVANNADVNAESKEGVTALMMAAFSGADDAVQLLIENSADVNAQLPNASDVPPTYGPMAAIASSMRQCGSTALSLAEGSGHAEIAEYLKQHGAKK